MVGVEHSLGQVGGLEVVDRPAQLGGGVLLLPGQVKEAMVEVALLVGFGGCIGVFFSRGLPRGLGRGWGSGTAAALSEYLGGGGGLGKI